MVDIKIILKRGLEKIPGAGWAMQTALFIFIYRKWEVDRQTFTDFIEYFSKVGKKPWVSKIMFQIFY
jgi:1-acyl-sn-glycerol-3-phosphate acyltransferase